MPNPDLSDMAHFVAVAEVNSFRKAAQRGGTSASSLSDAIRRLEAAVGAPLLIRTTRSVTLTEAGRQLLERVKPALEEITAAASTAGKSALLPLGTLRLNVPTIAARTFLTSLAVRFLQAHPGIQLEIVADDSFTEILAAGFDAGIRYEESLARDMIAIPIGPKTQHFVAAASPAYLASRGTPRHPDELLEHPLISHRFLSGATYPWTFERKGKTVRIRPAGPLATSQSELQLAAAIAGLGVIYTFEETVRAALASGELVPVLNDWWQSFNGPSLYFPSRRQMTAPLRAFVDFVKAQSQLPGLPDQP